MVPPNNDDMFDNSGDDDSGDEGACTGAQSQARGAGGPGKKGGKRAAVAVTSLDKVQLPLPLGPQLTLVSLGRIEWLNGAFHNENTIFPVGFTAVRTVATPASSGKQVRQWWRCGDV